MAPERSYWERFWQRRTTRRRVLKGAALGGAGLAAAAVIGCGEEEKPAATATPTAPAATSTPRPAATATPTPAAAVPKRGGALRTWIWNADMPGLDLVKQINVTLYIMSSLWYNRLYRFKTSAEDPTLNEKLILEPELALSHEVSADGLTWSFKLRQGVKWQNKAPVNGREFTIQDVKFNIDRFFKESPWKGKFTTIVDQVQYPDNQTLVFKLKAPYAAFAKELADPAQIYFYPPEVIEKEGDAQKTAIGTGPFILDRWESGTGTFSVRNPDYWEKGLDGQPLPYVAELQAFVYKDVSTVVAQYRAGQLDHNVQIIPVDQMQALQKSNPEIKWIVRPYWSIYYHAFAPKHYPYEGTNEPPFNDPRVRQAVSMAVDRKSLSELIYGGQAVQGGTVVPPTLSPFYLDPDKPDFGPNAKYLRYNLQEAKQLLQAAGQGGGFSTDYYLNAGWPQGYKDEMEAMVSMFKQVGINAAIQTKEYNDYIGTAFQGKGWWKEVTGMTYTGFTPQVDVHGFVFEQLHPQGARNQSRLNDPEIVPLVEKQRSTLNQEERVKIIQEIQRLVAGKAYYFNWLLWPRPVAIQPWLKNYHHNSYYGLGPETYARLWIDKG